LFWLRLLNIS